MEGYLNPIPTVTPLVHGSYLPELSSHFFTASTGDLDSLATTSFASNSKPSGLPPSNNQSIKELAPSLEDQTRRSNYSADINIRTATVLYNSAPTALETTLFDHTHDRSQLESPTSRRTQLDAHIVQPNKAVQEQPPRFSVSKTQSKEGIKCNICMKSFPRLCDLT